jgi:hypothetical protein
MDREVLDVSKSEQVQSRMRSGFQVGSHDETHVKIMYLQEKNGVFCVLRLVWYEMIVW